MRAWVFQDSRQKRKVGDKAPWSVGWYDLDGKKRSKRIGSRSMAQKFARKIEGQLAAGTYQSQRNKQWTDFRVEYEARILDQKAPGTRREVKLALDHFERICKPVRVCGIRTCEIDRFISVRRREPGKRRPGTNVSPATVNKELRHIKAAVRVATDWGYLLTLPKFRMVQQPYKLPRYMTPEHFSAIYHACGEASRPTIGPFAASDWWRGLLAFLYMTGWRIGEALALEWREVDLQGGTAVTRAVNNKGRRDASVPLHRVVIDHLRRIKSFDRMVFPWRNHRRTLDVEFHLVQKAAGIRLECSEGHDHTEACGLYGFHDLRRAFATVNADRMTADALQGLMRHQSYLTTQRYINISRQLNRAAQDLYVPDVLRKAD